MSICPCLNHRALRSKNEPKPNGIGSLEGFQSSEVNVEVGLALSRRIPLTWSAWTIETKPCVTYIVRGRIHPGVLRTANLHSIQDVKELHSEFRRNAFAEEELLRQCDVFVAVKGVAETC